MKKWILGISLFLAATLAWAQPAPTPVLNQAKQIRTDVSNFNHNLSSSDTDVQKALDTLDNLTTGSSGVNWSDPANIIYTGWTRSGGVISPTNTSDTVQVPGPGGFQAQTINSVDPDSLMTIQTGDGGTFIGTSGPLELDSSAATMRADGDTLIGTFSAGVGVLTIKDFLTVHFDNVSHVIVDGDISIPFSGGSHRLSFGEFSTGSLYIDGDVFHIVNNQDVTGSINIDTPSEINFTSNRVNLTGTGEGINAYGENFAYNEGHTTTISSPTNGWMGIFTNSPEAPFDLNNISEYNGTSMIIKGSSANGFDPTNMQLVIKDTNANVKYAFGGSPATGGFAGAVGDSNVNGYIGEWDAFDTELGGDGRAAGYAVATDDTLGGSNGGYGMQFYSLNGSASLVRSFYFDGAQALHMEHSAEVNGSDIIPGQTDANFMVKNPSGSAVMRFDGQDYAKMEYCAHHSGTTDTSCYQFYARNDGSNPPFFHMGLLNDAENSEGLGFNIYRDGTGATNVEFGGNHFGVAGKMNPTARLHLPASTASANTAQLKFDSGTLMTTAEVGAIEFLTDKWYATITTGAARKELTLNDSALTSGDLPEITTNGRLKNSAGTGFVKVSSGVVSYDNSTYLTGNQTITHTNDVTGSGTTSIADTINWSATDLLASIPDKDLNWVDFTNSKLNTTGINWTSVVNSEIQTTGINWPSVVNSEIQNVGINWTSLQNNIQANAINWTAITQEVQTDDINWGSFPGTQSASTFLDGTQTFSNPFTSLKNTFCRVTYGAGDGGAANYTVADFNVINFHSLDSYSKTDPGSHYVDGPDGSGNVDYYLVPNAGYYEIVSSVRVTDGNGGDNLGLGTDNDPNQDGTNAGFDSPSFHWYTTDQSGSAGSRGTYQDVHIAHFNANDHIIAFGYSDSGSLTTSDGSMTIFELFAD